MRAAAVGASFLDRAKTADGNLFFSVTKSGSKIRLQRKPYSGVFYAMACLQAVTDHKSLLSNCVVQYNTRIRGSNPEKDLFKIQIRVLQNKSMIFKES